MAPALTALVSGPSVQTTSPPTTMNRPTRSELVRSSWQLIVTTGRRRSEPMCSTSRVLPHPVGPVSMTGIRRLYACSNNFTSLPLAKYRSVVMCPLAGCGSCGDQLSVNVGKHTRKFLDTPNPLGAAGSEHLGERVHPGRTDADVIRGDTRIVGFVDCVRHIGPGVAAFVSLVGHQAVADHDQQTPFGRLGQKSTCQMAHRRT